MMKVAALNKPGGVENIVIANRDTPKPGAREVLVKVAASSLNYHDYAVALGSIPVADGCILMSDGAGEVVEAGAGTTRFKPGDKVISTFFPNWTSGTGTASRRTGVPGDQANGFAAEYVTCPETALTRMPKGYSFAEAATLPCAALTAWRSLMVATHTKPGDVVLVQGTGGVSIFALQFAKAAGATVIATSSSNDKLKRLVELGADHVINYRETPEWGKAALALTGGHGVDAVVEVGGVGTLAQSITAARAGGHIGLIGILTGISGEVPTGALMRKNIVLTGITVGNHDDQEAMIRAIEASGIKPVIDRHYPLENLAEAFAYQASQKHFGKIVLDVSPA